MTDSQAHLVRARIEDIAKTIAVPNVTPTQYLTVLSGDENTLATLPAVRVLPGRALRRQPNGGVTQLVTRVFRIVLFVDVFNTKRPADDELVDVTKAEDWLDVIPLVFQACPRLELDAAGLAYVTGTEPMLAGDEPTFLVYRRLSYVGLVNDLPVTYRRA